MQDLDHPDPSLTAEADAALVAVAQNYFDNRRRRVDPFCRRVFGLRGTLRLHRAALGLDIVRAPLNVMLSPVFVLSRLLAALAGRLRMRRVQAWLVSRRILLPTDVSRAVEALIVRDLLELPWQARPQRGTHDALASAVLSEPAIRTLLADTARPSDPARHISETLGEYTGTRSAVAEMTTAVFTLGTGAVVFQTITPGVLSFAPTVAALAAYHSAVTAFPMGTMVGGWWYVVFPPDPPLWLSFATVVALAVCGSVVTAFSGILADPIQLVTGIHRRRLNRLVDTLERAFTGQGPAAFAAREHYLARLFDVADAGFGALRSFRG